MDTSLIYGIGGVTIGMLLGWLIASLRVQQTNAQHETELRLLEQALQQAQQETVARQEALQRHEQQLRQSELELRNLHSQLAAGHEKLQQLNHWRNECELLNQELRAQREVNSAQEAELREVTIRLEETRMAAEEKQRLLINSEQRLTTSLKTSPTAFLNTAAVRWTSKISKAWIGCCCRCVNSWTVSAVRCRTALVRRRGNVTR